MWQKKENGMCSLPIVRACRLVRRFVFCIVMLERTGRNHYLNVEKCSNKVTDDNLS